MARVRVSSDRGVEHTIIHEAEYSMALWLGARREIRLEVPAIRTAHKRIREFNPPERSLICLSMTLDLGLKRYEG